MRPADETDRQRSYESDPAVELRQPCRSSAAPAGYRREARLRADIAAHKEGHRPGRTRGRTPAHHVRTLSVETAVVAVVIDQGLAEVIPIRRAGVPAMPIGNAYKMLSTRTSEVPEPSKRARSFANSALTRCRRADRLPMARRSYFQVRSPASRPAWRQWQSASSHREFASELARTPEVGTEVRSEVSAEVVALQPRGCAHTPCASRAAGWRTRSARNRAPPGDRTPRTPMSPVGT